MKKDIYEHLAKIYLDSSKQQKKRKKKHPIFLNANFLYLGIITLVLITSMFIFTRVNLRSKYSTFKQQTALVLQPDVVKINYDFNAAKKEIYSVFLNNLNLSDYKTLAFSLKKFNPADKVSLRIELVNSFQESSEIYLKDIPQGWEEFKIALADFEKITDWNRCKELKFIAEEWNTKEKNNVIYIEEIRFLK